MGALTAAGHSADYIGEMARSLRRRDLVDVGKHGAILGNERIGKYLEAHLPATFEELEIPFKATTVDCQEGHVVVLGSGPLVPAVLASAAIPGLLSPVFHEERVLLDGGVLNNLPVDVIRAMTTLPVVAVDVAVPPNRKLNFKDTRSLKERLSSAFRGSPSLLTIELFLKAFDVPQRLITQSILALHPPDVLVRPDLDPNFRREDFQRAEEGIEAGYRSTLSALDEAGWVSSETDPPGRTSCT
jgi:NTE family protein